MKHIRQNVLENYIDTKCNADFKGYWKRCDMKLLSVASLDLKTDHVQNKLMHISNQLREI
jgi:hypothetical protein